MFLLCGTINDWKIFQAFEGSGETYHILALQMMESKNPVWSFYTVKFSNLIYRVRIAPEKIHNIFLENNKKTILSINCIEIPTKSNFEGEENG